jgi:aminoglycoside phosphotransferase (APT) family kinase protein
MIEINVALVKQLIRTQFPQWAELPVEPVKKGGWNNRTFRLGDSMSIRLPSALCYVAREGAPLAAGAEAAPAVADPCSHWPRGSRPPVPWAGLQFKSPRRVAPGLHHKVIVAPKRRPFGPCIICTRRGIIGPTRSRIDGTLGAHRA